jgi:hypothetical protein
MSKNKLEDFIIARRLGMTNSTTEYFKNNKRNFKIIPIKIYVSKKQIIN